MDWVERVILFLLFAMCVCLVIAIPLAINEENANRDAFMAECEKDRKHYECEAMWRAGNSHSAVVPMPMIIPVR